jgi:hypothetical protein
MPESFRASLLPRFIFRLISHYILPQQEASTRGDGLCRSSDDHRCLGYYEV